MKAGGAAMSSGGRRPYSRSVSVDILLEDQMGTQNQTPNSRERQPGAGQPKPGQDTQPDPRRGRGTKAKDAGNVPRSDDDVAGEGSEGTREDDAGSNVRNS